MALYQKYRPQTFAEVVNQEHIITTITNQLAGGKLAHAYLFSGSRGTGKTTTARLLAKSANCRERKPGEFEPCDNCSSCREISDSASIDVMEIDAASHTGVDNVRENIIENTQFKPTRSPYKIFIIDEVHMLSTASFNALLKTLEEPPSYALFILATTEIHKIPDTIVSRCLRFTFQKVPARDLKKHLQKICQKEKREVDDGVLDQIIRKSDGAVRDAISLLDQIIASGVEKITLASTTFLLPSVSAELQVRLATALVDKNANDGLNLITEILAAGLPSGQIFSDLILHLRAMLVYRADPEMAEGELELSGDLLEKFKLNSATISPDDLIHLLDMAMARSQQIKYSPLPQLPLEMLIIEWSGQSKTTTNEKKETKERATEVNTDAEPTAIPKKAEISSPSIRPTAIPLGSDCKSVSKDDIITMWPKFMSAVEGRFPSLVFLLKMATIENVDSENNLTIAVPYSFHQEKLSEKSCLNNLLELFNKLLESKIRLTVVTQKNDRPETGDSREIEDIAAAFGGQIVA
ncbi:MAG: DNA polymerase III subunit gamma/tau [Patescibacteria group bacterium]